MSDNIYIDMRGPWVNVNVGGDGGSWLQVHPWSVPFCDAWSRACRSAFAADGDSSPMGLLGRYVSPIMDRELRRLGVFRNDPDVFVLYSRKP